MAGYDLSKLQNLTVRQVVIMTAGGDIIYLEKGEDGNIEIKYGQYITSISENINGVDYKEISTDELIAMYYTSTDKKKKDDIGEVLSKRLKKDITLKKMKEAELSNICLEARNMQTAVGGVLLAEPLKNL